MKRNLYLFIIISILALSTAKLVAVENDSVAGCIQLDQLSLYCIQVSEKSYSVGKVDEESKIIYLWKEITMNAAEAFDHHLSQRGPIIAAEKYGYTLKEGTPCIKFLKTDERFEIGYWDPPTGTFFRWKGIQFDSLNLPEVFQKNLVIIEKNMRIAKYDIPISARFWESLFYPDERTEITR